MMPIRSLCSALGPRHTKDSSSSQLVDSQHIYQDHLPRQDGRQACRPYDPGPRRICAQSRAQQRVFPDLRHDALWKHALRFERRRTAEGGVDSCADRRGLHGVPLGLERHLGWCRTPSSQDPCPRNSQRRYQAGDECNRYCPCVLGRCPGRLVTLVGRSAGD